VYYDLKAKGYLHYANTKNEYMDKKIEEFITKVKAFSTSYNVEVVHTIFSADPGLIWSSERKLHNIFKNKSYKPSINFKGENECFAFDTVNECINLMNEIMKDV
jgi:hypothetical protein